MPQSETPGKVYAPAPLALLKSLKTPCMPHETNLVARARCGQRGVGDVVGWDHPRVNFKQRGSSNMLQWQAADGCTVHGQQQVDLSQ
jgi:hypothetical protein